MLFYKQQRSRSNIRHNATEGIYVPKESRIQQKQAFCGAHFNLGDPSQSKSPPTLSLANNSDLNLTPPFCLEFNTMSTT